MKNHYNRIKNDHNLLISKGLYLLLDHFPESPMHSVLFQPNADLKFFGGGEGLDFMSKKLICGAPDSPKILVITYFNRKNLPRRQVCEIADQN